MRVKKTIINLILGTATVLALYILIKTICLKEWNTVSSSLAVITAIIASWGAQRVIWRQEEELEPKLDISIDIDNRKGAAQLVVNNIGGSTAYSVVIKWKKPLRDHSGKIIQFNSGEQGIDFKRIGKGQKYRYYIGMSEDLYAKSKNENELLEFEGFIKYKTNEKSKFNRTYNFFISLEPNRFTRLDVESDYNNFLSEGSKIHEDLKKIYEILKNK